MPAHKRRLNAVEVLCGRGTGKIRLAHVCERAAALGAREVWMQVNKRNERAIGAYRKAGFRIEKEATFDIGHGFVMDDYLMAKKLPESARA